MAISTTADLAAAEQRQQLPDAVLDRILAWQVLVAWAGEGNGELQRLGWWRTDLTDEYGGADFFKRLLPKTQPWASLEAVRQAAVQHDQKMRSRLAQPDLINTLFFWGFAADEQLADRLALHKRQQHAPEQCLDLPLDLSEAFDSGLLQEALSMPGQPVGYKIVPVGREVEGDGLPAEELRSRHLAAALLPLTDHYPMPFYRLDFAHAR